MNQIPNHQKTMIHSSAGHVEALSTRLRRFMCLDLVVTPYAGLASTLPEKNQLHVWHATSKLKTSKARRIVDFLNSRDRELDLLEADKQKSNGLI